MPTVPFGQAMQGQATRPAVDPIFEAIAVADLHEAGLLFEQRAEPVKQALATGDFDAVGANSTEFTRSPRLDRRR